STITKSALSSSARSPASINARSTVVQHKKQPEPTTPDTTPVSEKVSPVSGPAVHCRLPRA
ncbi:hypothetical protein BgiBS90_034406, partial [Biomphalaria glabrata]